MLIDILKKKVNQINEIFEEKNAELIKVKNQLDQASANLKNEIISVVKEQCKKYNFITPDESSYSLRFNKVSGCYNHWIDLDGTCSRLKYYKNCLPEFNQNGWSFTDNSRSDSNIELFIVNFTDESIEKFFVNVDNLIKDFDKVELEVYKPDVNDYTVAIGNGSNYISYPNIGISNHTLSTAIATGNSNWQQIDSDTKFVTKTNIVADKIIIESDDIEIKKVNAECSNEIIKSLEFELDENTKQYTIKINKE